MKELTTMEEKQNGGGAAEAKTLRTDWRSGKAVLLRDQAFWSAHEARRVELGQSVRGSCEANGLALSTYRHRASGRPRRARGSEASEAPAAARFIAVTPAASEQPCTVEVRVGEGMSVRLGGSAAERVVAQLLARLA
jgi:hypothetical protein